MDGMKQPASSPERGAGGTEPLACPFCGSAASVYPLSSRDTTGENGGADYYSWWKIACEACGISSMGASSERAAIAAWNRRAASVVPTGDAPAPSDDVGLNRLAQRVAAANRKWWFAPDGSPLKRNKGELLMLVVTEIAEAFEGERKNLMDDKLPHRRMAEVEVADAIIRLLDYAQAHGYDLDGAYREKMAYNATREDHKREAAQIAAGNGL